MSLRARDSQILQRICRYFAGKNQATGVQCIYAYDSFCDGSMRSCLLRDLCQKSIVSNPSCTDTEHLALRQALRSCLASLLRRSTRGISTQGLSIRSLARGVWHAWALPSPMRIKREMLSWLLSLSNVPAKADLGTIERGIPLCYGTKQGA
jgi:hypothetical protein